MLVRYNSQNGFTGFLNSIKHLKNIPEITDDVKNALNNLNPPLINNMKNMVKSLAQPMQHISNS